jgi:ankyrin repeat protein
MLRNYTVLIALLLHVNAFAQNNKEIALLEAIKSNDLKQVRSLLDQGPNPNYIDDDSDNLLINAAIYSSADCMKLLLKKGADPNFKNALGETPLMFSVPNEAKTKILIDNGADINAKANSGNTVLMVAVVGNNQYNITKTLLQKGADPLIKNSAKETALARAALYGDTSTISLLLSKGIDINAQDVLGETALINAIFNSNKPVALQLLQKGADVEPRIAFGLNALQIAVIYGEMDIINALLAKAKDINVIHEDGLTTLMWATYGEHDNPAVIQALLDKGADPNLKSKEGRTALWWAMKKGNTQTVDLLKKAGAKE